MVDPLTAATAAGQFIGLAEQLVDAVMALRRKLANVKNAPNVIRRIRKELEVLQGFGSQLARIEDHLPGDAKSTFVQIFQQLEGSITDLNKILRKIDLQESDRGAKRFWNSFLADEQRPKLEEVLCNIKGANTTLATFLSGVNVRITREMHDHVVAHTATVSPAMKRIEASVSATARISENILTETLDTRKYVAQSTATIIHHVDQAGKSVVKSGLQEFFEEHQEDFIFLARKDRPDIGYRDENNNTKTARSSGRKHTVTKKFPFPIGLVQTKAVWAGVGKDATLLYVEVSLTPFRVFSSQGRHMRMDRSSANLHATSWNLSLQSYNIVRHNAMILQACRDRDVVAIEKLFQYGEASPYDVDCNGRSLLSYVWDGVSLRSRHKGAEQIRQTIRFLIARGVDPTTYVQEFLMLYQTWAKRYWSENVCHGEGSVLDPTLVSEVELLDDALRLCIENSRTDPFANGESLTSLWEASLGGHSMPALGSSHLLREDLPGLEELAFENPDQVFYDIVAQRAPIIDIEVFRQELDRNYNTLMYLCKGGEQSIKNRIFSKDISRYAPLLKGGKTCFCPTNSSHLLFHHFHGWNCQWGWRGIERPDKRARAKVIRNHVHRVLMEILSSGENPEARCDCKTTWQWPEGFRTVTDIAGEEGLLNEWEAALEQCGHNATRIIDEWRFVGVPELFMAQEPALPRSPGESSPHSKSFLAVVGGLIYQTISTIV